MDSTVIGVESVFLGEVLVVDVGLGAGLGAGLTTALVTGFLTAGVVAADFLGAGFFCSAFLDAGAFFLLAVGLAAIGLPTRKG
ncbi:MAG: hypothetical protein ACK48P_02960 [Holosporales bacterium]